MLVYRIINIISGKVYIGSTKDFPNRKKSHIEDLYNKRHHNIFLQRDFDKLGLSSFKFEVIEDGFKNRTLMIAREYQIINSISNKYNIQTKDYSLPVESKNQKVVVQKNRVLIILRKENIKKKKTKKRISYSEKVKNRYS